MTTQTAPNTTSVKNALGLIEVKGIALGVTDLDRANEFYGKTLGLEPFNLHDLRIGWALGGVGLLLKTDWHTPTDDPNYRITLMCEDARKTEEILKSKGVRISDPVTTEDEYFSIGSFLDSEGNKLWFCSDNG